VKIHSFEATWDLLRTILMNPSCIQFRQVCINASPQNKITVGLIYLSLNVAVDPVTEFNFALSDKPSFLSLQTCTLQNQDIRLVYLFYVLAIENFILELFKVISRTGV